jgi:hypothetical protein
MDQKRAPGNSRNPQKGEDTQTSPPPEGGIRKKNSEKKMDIYGGAIGE